MELKILKEQENTLLKRKEVTAEFSHTGKPTPLRKEMLASLTKALKTKEELLIIDKVLTRTGIAQCEVRVLVYKSPGDIPKEKTEKQARRLGKKEKKPKEAEKPAEEKKEPEKKEEPKKEEEKKETPKEEKPAEEKKE